MAVEDYLAQFTGEPRQRLETVRALVAESAPDAVEAMAYGLIGWKLAGRPLIYVGSFAHHLGLYATPQGHQEFAEKFAPYKQGKGLVQFPHDQPLPTDLIGEVVRFRVASLAS